MHLRSFRYQRSGFNTGLLLIALISSGCAGDRAGRSAGQSFGHLQWQFPLTRPQEGILLGNGEIGAMIWGEGNTLNITIGKADFWDHQGGHPLEERFSYQKLLRHLENGSISEVYDILRRQREEMKPGVLPLGRLELVLDEKHTLLSGRLDPASGTAILDCHHPLGQRRFELLNNLQ